MCRFLAKNSLTEISRWREALALALVDARSDPGASCAGSAAGDALSGRFPDRRERDFALPLLRAFLLRGADFDPDFDRRAGSANSGSVSPSPAEADRGVLFRVVIRSPGYGFAAYERDVRVYFPA
jgi:hypothetical protein